MTKNPLLECEGFQWDDGNSDKNWIRHGVSRGESEEVFFNRPLIVRKDEVHTTEDEIRYYCLGRTDYYRHLFVVFTVREKLIRVISARDMTRKEKRKYDEEIKRNS